MLSPRLLLAPLAPVYGAAVSLRARFYRPAGSRRRSLGAPVVSVGNLTTGGTGKTPVVASLARRFRDLGCRVAVLSRGYGRSTRGIQLVSDGSGPVLPVAEAGDEPFLLARELPGVAVVVGEDRRAAGEWAERRLGVDVHLLDDGFQHLALARDLDVLVIDAARTGPRLRLMPWGPLREPLSAMGRADLVLLTHTHLAHDEFGLRRLVRTHNPLAPILAVEPRFVGLAGPAGETDEVEALRGRRLLALSAIGSPAQFEADLRGLGGEVVAVARFRDHHRYTRRDLDRIVRMTERAGAEWVVTTAKDLVRLEPVTAGNLPCTIRALRLEVAVRDAPELNRRLDTLLRPAARAGL